MAQVALCAGKTALLLASIHRLAAASLPMRCQPLKALSRSGRQLIPPGEFFGHGPILTVSAMFTSMTVNCFTTFSGLKPVEVRKIPHRSIIFTVVRIDEKEPFAPVVEHMVGTDLPSVMHHDNRVKVV